MFSIKNFLNLVTELFYVKSDSRIYNLKTEFKVSTLRILKSLYDLKHMGPNFQYFFVLMNSLDRKNEKNMMI